MGGQAAGESLLGLGLFLSAAREANFGTVIMGGFVGGLLQPVVARLNPKADDPLVESYWLSPLLGVSAAGISIYVLANSNTDDPLRLLFFALLCGLAFPTVLTSAVDNVGRRTTTVQRKVAQIAVKARGSGMKETAQAAQELRTVLARNPPETVKPEGQALSRPLRSKRLPISRRRPPIRRHSNGRSSRSCRMSVPSRRLRVGTRPRRMQPSSFRN